MRVHGSMLLYVHRNRKAHSDGVPRTATSTFTQLLNSEVCSRSIKDYSLILQWGTVDEEIKDPSVESPELTKLMLFR